MSWFRKEVKVCCCGSKHPGSYKIICEKCDKKYCWDILYDMVRCPHCGYCSEMGIFCNRCGGDGLAECEVCGGEGWFTHKDRAEDCACTHCHGRGEVRCLDCDGKGSL